MSALPARVAELAPARRRELLARLMREQRRAPRRAPVSFGQERLWFVEQIHPALGAYHIPIAIALHGKLDEQALRRAVEAIVERHEILRTRFEVVDGKVTQVILDDWKPALPHLELSALPPARAAVEGRRLAAELAGRRFDLRAAPPCRWSLLRLAAGEHLLQMVAHHIVLDAWSTLVLLRELSYFYDAFARRLRPLQPPLAVQYADFATWQRKRLEGGHLEQLLSYWRQALDGCPVLELPADRPRPPLQTFHGSRCLVEIGAVMLGEIAGYAQRRGTTLFVVLLAAWQALLSRYTGQVDIVVGSQVTGRERKELEELIGFFVNSLVLRASLAGEPSFDELTGRVRESVVGAVAHGEVPFEKLVLELQPARDLQRSPIFQAAISLLQVGMSRLELPGLAGEVSDLGLPAAKYELHLDLRELPGEWLRCYLEYNTDLYERTAMLRLLGHYRTLLAAAVAEPALCLGELPLLAAAERHQLLVEWNDTRADEERAALLHRRFEHRAQAAPDSLAAVCEGRRLTYGELNRRANRLARRLRARGVAPGSVVGLAIAEPIASLTALLGVLKAGGAYLPLDPAYPRERLAAMIEDARPELLLTAFAEPPGLPPAGSPPRVRLDLEQDALASQADGDLPGGAAADDLAYVIFTSGSTGRAKGAMLAHRGLASLLDSLIDLLGPRPGDLVLQLSSPSFDVSLAEIALALGSGATLRLVSRDHPLAGTGLADLLAEEGVSHALVTPSTLATLPPRSFPRLRALAATGEECPPRLAGRWAARQRLWDLYGPTETTIFATAGEGLDRCGRPLIGRPLRNVSVYALGRDGRPVPLGAEGELYVGGPGLARGYLGRPELTAERFVPDPFATRPGSRLYRTGDRVRYRPEGGLDYRGRGDQQLKVRGFRIEPGEVESALLREPAVREAVVVADGEGSARRLVAYLVWEGEPVPAAVLAARLAARIPVYMVPSLFLSMPSLPRTASGKLDRRSLPPPRSLLTPVVRRPPRTDLERQIAEAWCRALGLPEVSLDDNFFHLGGHSLMLVEVHSELSRELGREIALARLFEHPTIESLAACLSGGMGGEREPAAGAETVAATAPAARRTGSADRRRQLRQRMQRHGAAPAATGDENDERV